MPDITSKSKFSWTVILQILLIIVTIAVAWGTMQTSLSFFSRDIQKNAKSIDKQTVKIEENYNRSRDNKEIIVELRSDIKYIAKEMKEQKIIQERNFSEIKNLIQGER